MYIFTRIGSHRWLARAVLKLDPFNLRAAARQARGARAEGGASCRLCFTHSLALALSRLPPSDGSEMLAGLKTRFSQLKSAADKYAALEQKLEMAQHEAALTKKRLDNNPHFKAAEELRLMEEEVKNGDDLLAAKTKELKVAESEVQRLDKAIKEYTKSWDKLLEVKDKEIKKAKDDLTALQVRLSANPRLPEDFVYLKSIHILTGYILQAKLKATREQNEATLLESEAGEEEMRSLQEQVAAGELAVKKCEEDAAELEKVVAENREIFEEAEKKVKDKRNAIKQTDKDIAAASKDCDKCDKKVEEVKIAIKKLDHSMKQFDKESEDARKLVEHWLRQHPWIASERVHFGKAGGDYDWKATDPAKSKKRLAELNSQQDSLGKKINKKVMGMFEKAEQEYQDVMEKKRIVENDKRKIEQVIDELDEKKNQALKITWTKVNRDFSSIFHTLLPNARAKLEPPEGGTVLDGLVMKVCNVLMGAGWGPEERDSVSGNYRILEW
jgi:structural maintenance of chromosome 2